MKGAVPAHPVGSSPWSWRPPQDRRHTPSPQIVGGCPSQTERQPIAPVQGHSDGLPVWRRPRRRAGHSGRRTFDQSLLPRSTGPRDSRASGVLTGAIAALVELTEAPPGGSRDRIRANHPPPRYRQVVAQAAWSLSVGYSHQASLCGTDPVSKWTRSTSWTRPSGASPPELRLQEHWPRSGAGIIPYIGVVKSAISCRSSPSGAFSVPTIRLPRSLFLRKLGRGVLHGAEVIGLWSAILVVLMGTCPSFIFMSKVDWGPTAVQMLLTVTLLLAFLRYLRTGRIVYRGTVFALALSACSTSRFSSGSSSPSASAGPSSTDGVSWS